MKEDRAREVVTRTTIHRAEAVEGEEGCRAVVAELLEVEAIRTIVTLTMKSIMTTDLVGAPRVTTDRDVAPAVVRTVVEERITGLREKTAQRETVPQEGADSAIVVARVIKEKVLEEKVLEEKVLEEKVLEESVTHQDRSVQLRKLNMLDYQYLHGKMP